MLIVHVQTSVDCLAGYPDESLEDFVATPLGTPEAAHICLRHCFLASYYAKHATLATTAVS